MKTYFLSLLGLAVMVSACQTQKEPAPEKTPETVETKAPKAYEIPRTEVIPIKDSKSGGQYELYVKLPENYSEHQDSIHPVIYFTDAIWHMDILSASTEYLMENAVLVGISWQTDVSEALLEEVGPQVSRYRDYSVIPSKNEEHQAKYHFGEASAHLDFIRNDVIPYVEKNYRTDPTTRAYFGYSLGGLFGGYILLAQPDTFKNYILGSPSVQGDVPFLSEVSSNRRTDKKLDANVFISYGNLETELGAAAEQFITLLQNRKDESLALEKVVLEGSHQTAFPTTGVRGISWLSGLLKK
ncbi:MAG: alpha/beta hydrolase-fold protein [Bacteroidota bacterium]